MAHVRQSRGASGVRQVPRSLWERAGARAGDGAGALFARLDAQDAQEAPAPTPEAAGQNAQRAAVSQAREQGAQALERAAAAIRAGAWNAELAALVAAAVDLRGPGLDTDDRRNPRG